MTRSSNSVGSDISRRSADTKGKRKNFARFRAIQLNLGIEAGENVRKALDVSQQFALQPGWGIDRKTYLDRVGNTAKALFDHPRDLAVDAACREDAHDVIRHLGGHLVPAAVERHPVQFQSELVEPVQ